MTQYYLYVVFVIWVTRIAQYFNYICNLMCFRDKPSSQTSDMKDVRLTPPSSPSLTRRRQPILSQDPDNHNVFMRLTNNSATVTQTKKNNSHGAINSCEKVFICSSYSYRLMVTVLPGTRKNFRDHNSYHTSS